MDKIVGRLSATARPFQALRSGVSKLGSSGFLRSAAILSSGSAVGHVFTLAASPLLTRVFDPRDFGALGLFTSFLGVTGVAVSLQYESSIVSGVDESEAVYLTFGSLLLAGPVSLLSGLVLWALIHFSLLGFESLSLYAPLLMAFTMVATGVFNTLRFWSLRERRFVEVAQGRVAQSGGRAVLQVLFGVLHFHASGMLFGESLGRCLGMSKMVRGAWPVLKTHIESFSWRELLRVLKRNHQFPIYSLPSTFLDSLCLSLPLPLLIRMYGVSTGGQYSLVWKAITVPSVLVIASVADTFHTHLATCARDTPGQVMRVFVKTTMGLLIAGIVPAAILWFFGPSLFSWVFGAQWALSGALAAIVAPWYLGHFVVNPLSRTVLVLSGQKSKLVWDVLCLFSLIGVFWFARRQNLPVLQTVKLLSAVSALLFVVYYFTLVQIILRFNRTRCALPEAVQQAG